MAGSKSKRGVRFPQRSQNGLDGRRSSMSDASEDGSPAKIRAQAALAPVAEVRDT